MNKKTLKSFNLFNAQDLLNALEDIEGDLPEGYTLNEVNLESAGDVSNFDELNFIEETLTDGSKVYNIEID